MDAADIINGVNKGELIIARKCDLQDLFRDVMAEQMQDQRKGLMARKEVKKMLALRDDDAFDRLLRQPDCLIRRSKIQGKYIAQSVYDEIKRQSE